MTYKGVNIGRKPTFEQVKEVISNKEYSVDSIEVYLYWERKHWLTNKGTPVKTLENAIDVANGIIAQKKKKEGKNTKPSKRQRIQKPKKASVPVLQEEKLKSRMSYDTQLQDKRWKAFREFIFAVRGRWCERCGTPLGLQIHHPKYISGRLAWEYTCNEVQVLCDKCHKKEHNILN